MARAGARCSALTQVEVTDIMRSPHVSLPNLPARVERVEQP